MALLKTNSPSFTLENTQQIFDLNRGYSLLNNLLLNDVTSHAKCGGKAVCSRCRIKITSGLEYCNKPVAEEKVLLTQEELNEGWRLACQTFCLKSLSLYLPSLDEIDK